MKNKKLKNNVFFTEGLKLYKKNLYEDAIEKLKKGIDIDPENEEFLFILAQCRFNLKLYRESIGDLTKLIKLNQKDSTYYYLRGLAKRELGELKEADIDFNESELVNSKYGIEFFEKCLYKEALIFLEEVVESDPRYLTCLKYRAISKANLLQYKNAISDFNKYIGLNSSDAQVFHDRGECYEKIGKYEKAVKDYKNALEIQPRMQKPLYPLVNAYLALGKYPVAIIELNKIINSQYLHHKDSHLFYYLRGVCKKHLNKFEDAIQDFDKAIKLNPEGGISPIGGYFYLRGVCKRQLNKFKDAFQDFDKAIKVSDEKYFVECSSPEFFNERGYYYFFIQKYKEAIHDFDQAIKLNPKNASYFYNLGRSYYFLEQYDKAIKDFDEAIKLNPKNADYFIELGNTYLSLEDFKFAENKYKKAYELNSDAVELKCNMGFILYRKKDYYFSIKELLDALKIDPLNYKSYAILSLSKLGLENYKDSYYDLKKSEELFNRNKSTSFFSNFDDEDLNKFLKIYETNNDLEQVEKILEFIHKKNNCNSILLSKGILQFKKGDFYNAISTFIDVYKDDNQNKECIIYLAKAKLALKDYKNALRDFKKYKELDPSDDVDKLIKTCEENLSSN